MSKQPGVPKVSEEVRLPEPATRAPGSAPRFRQVPSPCRSPNFAFAGIIFSIPFAVSLFVVLLIYEVAPGPALLMAWVLQTAVFGGAIAAGLIQNSRAVEHGQRSTVQHSPVEDDLLRKAADTWWTYPRRCDKGIQLRAAMIAPDVLDSRRMATEMTSQGFEVHHCDNPGAILASARSRPRKWDLLIFDTASAADLESAVDQLLGFRALFPETRVVLISDYARHDEFTGERHAICDVTLAKPVDQGRLFDAVEFSGATAAPVG